MKFKLIVKKIDDDDSKAWEEDYEKEIENVEEWAKETIEFFNDTLSPYEKPRELLKIIIEDNTNEALHDWFKRTDGTSVNFRGKIVDLMKCNKCGITGKKYGLSSHVKIDSKFNKKCFKNCKESIEELSKNYDKYY